MSERAQQVLLALVLVPVPLVVLVALLRGYSVTLVLRRDRRQD